MLSNYNLRMDIPKTQYLDFEDNIALDPISIDEILSKLYPLPTNASLLGVMGDGTPLVFDLSDPEHGSLLAIGSNIFETNKIIEQFIYCLVIINDPGRVHVHRIQSERGILDKLKSFAHIKQTYSPFSEEGGLLIEEMCNLHTDRKNGMSIKPVQLLVIENIFTIIPSLPDDVLNSLLNLIIHGPEENIWVLAGIPEKDLTNEVNDFLEAFNTLLIGKLTENPILTRLDNYDNQFFSQIIPGKEYIVHSGGETLLVNLLRL